MNAPTKKARLTVLVSFLPVAGLICLLAPATSGLAASSVSAWGYYYDLTMPETYRPMYVPAGLTNVIAVAGGYNHAYALKSDGNLIGWGWNGNGATNIPANV